MSDHESEFALPFNPLTAVSACDQLDGAYAAAEEKYGPDMMAWPPLLLARLNVRCQRLMFWAQCNEQAAIRERDRIDRIDGMRDVPE